MPTVIFTTTTTFATPGGVTAVEVWGAGGGGCTTGGGGGGAVEQKQFANLAASTYNVVVGTGGSGAGGNNATDGGGSSFVNSSTAFAAGGSGAVFNGGSNSPGGSSASGVGDSGASGGAGFYDLFGGGGSGAGGNGLGSLQVGGDGSSGSGGAAPPVGGGQGGGPTNSPSQPGGGGSSADGGGGGQSGADGQVVVTFAVVPTGLAGTPSTNAISLTWNAADQQHLGVTNNGTTFYKVYRNTDSFTTPIYNGQNLSFTDTGRLPGTQYTYEITSYSVTSMGILVIESAKSSGVAVTTTALSSPLVPDLIWYQFNVINGTTVKDDSTNGTHTGTLNNSPVYVPGKSGGHAIKLDGSSTYIAIPDVFSYPTSGVFINSYNLTIALWFKTTGTGVGGILGQVSPNTILPGQVPGGWCAPIYVDTNGLLNCSIFYNSQTLLITSKNKVNDGQWHHVAITCLAGTVNLESVYLDGTLIGTVSTSEGGYAATYVYYIGSLEGSGWPNATSGWFYFGGVVDDFRVYSRALAASEVLQIMGSGSSERNRTSPTRNRGRLN